MYKKYFPGPFFDYFFKDYILRKELKKIQANFSIIILLFLMSKIPAKSKTLPPASWTMDNFNYLLMYIVR